MDIALCTLDNKEWKIEQFREISDDQLSLMRRNLLCIECHGNAWYRKSSYGNDSPHFCAHHKEGCSFATSYTIIGEGDGGEAEPASNPDSIIVIDLVREKNYQIDVKPTEPSLLPPSGLFRSNEQISNGGGVDFPTHLTLKNILYRLIRSSLLPFVNERVVIRDDTFKNLPTEAKELFVNFKNVSYWLDDHQRAFWGFISDAGQTKDNKIWLNAGNITSGLSIAINEKISQEFKEYFKIDESLESLSGCHVLVIGTCRYTSTGKPIIWCTNLNHIVLRRYNFTDS